MIRYAFFDGGSKVGLARSQDREGVGYAPAVYIPLAAHDKHELVRLVIEAVNDLLKKDE